MAERVPPCPIPGYKFGKFSTWLQVRHAAETNEALYYWAPLDQYPVRMCVRRVFKNGKIRVSSEYSYTFDEKHLGRFYKLEKINE